MKSGCLSREMQRDGVCRDAIRTLTEALPGATTQEEEMLILQERASVHIRAGDARRGMLDADSIIQSLPRSAVGYLVKSKVMTALRRYEEAESILRLAKAQATEKLSAEFHETLLAAKAKNIMRRVEQDLQAKPGMLGDSIKRLTEAIGEGIPHQHSHKARLRRSELRVQAGQYEHAINDCKQCLIEMPSHSGTWAVLAEAYDGIGQHKEAKNAYYRSLQEGPRDSGHTLHKEEGEISSQQQTGNASFQEGRFNEAIAAYSKALALIEAYGSGATQRRAELLSNRSVARLKVSQIQEAVDDAKECIVHAPHWPKAYYRLGMAFLTRNNYLHAMGAAKTSRGHVVPGGVPGADGCDIRRAEQAFSVGAQYGDAGCREGLVKAADAREALINKALVDNDAAVKLFIDGAFTAAFTRLEAALLSAGDACGHTSQAALEKLRDLADFNELIKNHESSIAWRRTLLQAKPQSVIRTVDLGVALRVAGHYEEAISLLKSAVQRLTDLHPDGHVETVLALQDLASCYRESLEPAGAQKAYLLLQRATQMARRVGGEVSVLYAMTMHNLIIILGLLGTRDQELKEVRYRASKLLRGLRSTKWSIFVGSVELWMNPGDLFELNRWPNRRKSPFQGATPGTQTSESKTGEGSRDGRGRREGKGGEEVTSGHTLETPRLCDDSTATACSYSQSAAATPVAGKSRLTPALLAAGASGGRDAAGFVIVVLSLSLSVARTCALTLALSTAHTLSPAYIPLFELLKHK
jgi:tetratricopeptide (TPR) repeat protein